MRVLVTGYKGQLGYDVVKRLEKMAIPCQGVDIDDFDLTDAAAVAAYVRAYAPDTVIHCAAYTAVDRAEEDKATSYAVNVGGTENIARACREIDARMVYISTDYVFAGDGDQPYETDSPKAPQSQYGLTKSLGEDKVRALLQKYFIVRIAWVFGINGNNFIKTMLRLGKEKDEINVVCDQFGSPTYTADLAVLLAAMIQTDRYGIYHATNEGFCSWYEFAGAIMKTFRLKAKVVPITSDQYPSKVARPKNSRRAQTSLDRAGFQRLPDWQDALERFKLELNP